MDILLDYMEAEGSSGLDQMTPPRLILTTMKELENRLTRDNNLREDQLYNAKMLCAFGVQNKSSVLIDCTIKEGSLLEKELKSIKLSVYPDLGLVGRSCTFNLLVGGQMKQITHIVSPVRRVPKYLTKEKAATLGYHYSTGLRSRSGLCQETVQAILPKHDGQYMYCYVLYSGRNAYGLVVIGTDTYIIPGWTEAFSGEFMGDTIRLQYGQQTVSKLITINGKNVELQDTYTYDMRKILHMNFATTKCDGFMIVTDRDEYRLKFTKTDDVLVQNNHIYVDNIDRGEVAVSVPDGVYEVLNSNQTVVVRPRPDKSRGLTQQQINEIRNSLSVSEFYDTQPPKDAIMEREAYAYPKAVIHAEVAKIGPFNTERLKEWADAHRVVVSATSIADLEKGRYSKFKTTKLLYATRKDIYQALKEKQVMTVVDAADYVSNVTGKAVSLRKMMLMMTTSVLWYYKGYVGVPHYAGKPVNFNSHVVLRTNAYKRGDSVVIGLTSYNRFNHNAFDEERSKLGLERECVEAADPMSGPDEIGDVIMMTTKYVAYHCSNGKVLYDPGDPLWETILGLSVMMPFVDKMKVRLEKYACVRSHKSSESHCCSSGIDFKKEDRDYLREKLATFVCDVVEYKYLQPMLHLEIHDIDGWINYPELNIFKRKGVTY